MTSSSDIDQIVQAILVEMPLKEKAAIASPTGWADSRTGFVAYLSLSAEGADHLIPLASVSIIGRTP